MLQIDSHKSHAGGHYGCDLIFYAIIIFVVKKYECIVKVCECRLRELYSIPSH